MTADRAARLVTAFEQRFGGQVELYHDDGDNGRFQFSVVSPQFTGLTQLERQDAVWEAVDKVLSREESLDVSMVWTFAPGEMEEWIRGLSA